MKQFILRLLGFKRKFTREQRERYKETMYRGSLLKMNIDNTSMIQRF